MGWQGDGYGKTDRKAKAKAKRERFERDVKEGRVAVRKASSADIAALEAARKRRLA